MQNNNNSKNENNKSGKREVASHVFNGSTTMAGVSVTIIALFRITKGGASTYADEILAANTCLFFSAAILSYMSLRRDKYATLENVADVLFFTGLVVMMVVGILIVYTTY